MFLLFSILLWSYHADKISSKTIALCKIKLGHGFWEKAVLLLLSVKSTNLFYRGPYPGIDFAYFTSYT